MIRITDLRSFCNTAVLLTIGAIYRYSVMR